MENLTDKQQFEKRLPEGPDRPELLAPAGSFETCRAVIFAGADAVYAGGSRFGARAYAENFTREELLEAIDFAHLYGKKLYLTVNTLLKQTEMEDLYAYLLPYYECGLDAVIVQDLGVMQLVHDCFPGLPVHISTQMSVASAYGFAYLRKLGAVRIVTARELSLDEIRKIRGQSDLEIECFVHGALCYCYSGQCLLSSMLGGRSGNRGRCAQPCRLPYTILDEKHHQLPHSGKDGRKRQNMPHSGKDGRKQQNMPETECYPLSLKDLCTIDEIPRLIEAGITSFKIEGRMKSAEYAAGVTAVYRNYIDRYLETGASGVRESDYERLLHTGNRSGFTNGYYSRQNGPDMISMTRPNHEKSEAADLCFLREKKIPVQAEVFVKAGEPAGLSVTACGHCVSVRLGMAQEAKNQPVSRETITGQLSRTGNTPFTMERITVHMDDPVFLPKQTLNQLRREALEQLKERILQHYRRNASRPKTNGLRTCQSLQSEGCGVNGRQAPRPKGSSGSISADTDASVLCFSAAVEESMQLNAVLEQEFVGRVYLDSSMYRQDHFAEQLKKHTDRIHAAGKQAYLTLPPVFRGQTAQFYSEQWQRLVRSGIDGYLVKTLDELGFLERMQADPRCCILDHSLYTYSDHTKACYAEAGWLLDTVPLELNKKELRARNNTASELIIYGRLPLMISAQCIQKTCGRCTKTNGLCYLKDRFAKEFPVKNICGECYNTIYNSQPLSLIQLAEEVRQLRPASYRLWFTIESEETARRVLESVKAAFLHRQTPDMKTVIGAYTNGHYKRGTE